MADDDRCAQVRDLIPELALGVASGEMRAMALAHLAGCDDCRRELEDVSTTVDDLLTLAPQREPPLGFESRVLGALAQSPRRRRVYPALLAAAAAVLVATLAAGLTWWHTADDRAVADQYRHVLSLAHGSYMTAAELKRGTSTAGSVFAYQGKPSWVFVTVDGAKSGTYHVRMIGADGSSHWLGRCHVQGGHGSWGTTVGLPIQEVTQVQMYGAGLPTLTANLAT